MEFETYRYIRKSWLLRCPGIDGGSEKPAVGTDIQMGTAITFLVVMIALVASLAFAFVMMDFLLTVSFDPEGGVRAIAKLLRF